MLQYLLWTRGVLSHALLKYADVHFQLPQTSEVRPKQAFGKALAQGLHVDSCFTNRGPRNPYDRDSQKEAPNFWTLPYTWVTHPEAHILGVGSIACRRSDLSIGGPGTVGDTSFICRSNTVSYVHVYVHAHTRICMCVYIYIYIYVQMYVSALYGTLCFCLGH